MKLLTQDFTAKEVAALSGATSKQITDWCNQGLVVGQREPLGRGHKRTFSWFNIMEIAGAVSLMEIGIRSPGDAFRASTKFAHMADGGCRIPGLPFHHSLGTTFVFVAGSDAEVILVDEGEGLNWFQIVGRGGKRKRGFVAMNVTELFASIMGASGLRDYRILLDEAYPETAT